MKSTSLCLLSILLIGGLSLAVWSFRGSIAWIYTDDPVIAARAAALFAVAALVFVRDQGAIVG